jgi:hypothetical protein
MIEPRTRQKRKGKASLVTKIQRMSRTQMEDSEAEPVSVEVEAESGDQDVVFSGEDKTLVDELFNDFSINDLP